MRFKELRDCLRHLILEHQFNEVILISAICIYDLNNSMNNYIIICDYL